MEITVERLVNELKGVLPEDRVVVNTTVRELHSKDESYHTSSLPDVVVFPKTTEEVSRIMEVASEHKKPV
ncbi:FAD-binding oxidoreductase, partial [Bacillus wiedmannii]